MAHIYLASASPRRAELLNQIGVNFDVLNVAVDENSKQHESVEDYVARLAFAKVIAGREVAPDKEKPVLGADTAVFVDGEILGKPLNFDDGKRMLLLLSGKTHQVLTAVSIARGVQQEPIVATVNTSVTFREISASEIEAYWATSEPKGKAGGYAIQGRAAVFVSHLEGSYSGVMGLPLFETAQLLMSANV